MIQDKFSMEQQDNIFYAKRNIVDSIYSQSKLEGIAVTFPDTQEIYEGRSVAGLSVEDIVKVNNLTRINRKSYFYFLLLVLF